MRKKANAEETGMQRVIMWLGVALAATALSGIARAQAPDPGQGQGASAAPRMWKAHETEEMIIDRLVSRPELGEHLGLNAEQKESLKKVRLDMGEQMISLRAELEKVALRQANLISERTPDEAAILKVVEETGAIHTKLAKLRVQQLLAVRKILTAEQLAKARETIREQIKSRREEGGRAGEGPRRPTMGQGKTGEPVPSARQPPAE